MPKKQDVNRKFTIFQIAGVEIKNKTSKTYSKTKMKIIKLYYQPIINVKKMTYITNTTAQC